MSTATTTTPGFMLQAFSNANPLVQVATVCFCAGKASEVGAVITGLSALSSGGTVLAPMVLAISALVLVKVAVGLLVWDYILTKRVTTFREKWHQVYGTK
tara:strand:- start:229 stop:528 length:300 start_codon:yes stop_codon:yes gene_type:complete